MDFDFNRLFFNQFEELINTVPQLAIQNDDGVSSQNCRHYMRQKKRPPYKLWDRTCAKCNKQIKTVYSPQNPEIVYCEECYLREVY